MLAVLLCAATSTSAFSGRAFVRCPSPRVRPALLQFGGERDAAARAAARAARAGRLAQDLPPAPEADAIAAQSVAQRLRGARAPEGAAPQLLDSDDVANVLGEFARSDYVRQLCDYCNVQPTDYGTIRCLFKSVRTDGAKLVVKLNPTVEQRSEKLLDRLKKHLRATMPAIKQIHYEQGSPPTTRTIIV